MVGLALAQCLCVTDCCLLKTVGEFLLGHNLRFKATEKYSFHFPHFILIQIYIYKMQQKDILQTREKRFQISFTYTRILFFNVLLNSYSQFLQNYDNVNGQCSFKINFRIMRKHLDNQRLWLKMILQKHH